MRSGKQYRYWTKSCPSLKRKVLKKVSFNSNSSSKSNTECITKNQKFRINNIKNIVATLNINSLVSKFDELKVIGQGIFNILIISKTNPTSNYIFKANNRSTRTRCEICSKLTIKTPKRRWWRCSGAFIVNFEHASHLFLVLLLLTLSR